MTVADLIALLQQHDPSLTVATLDEDGRPAVVTLVEVEDGRLWDSPNLQWRSVRHVVVS